MMKTMFIMILASGMVYADPLLPLSKEAQQLYREEARTRTHLSVFRKGTPGFKLIQQRLDKLLAIKKSGKVKGYEIVEVGPWKEWLKDRKKNESKIINELIKVASTPFASTANRAEAIKELGTFDTKESFRFLLENIRLFIPSGELEFYVDLQRDHPCYTALINAKWKVVPWMIKYASEKKREPKDRSYMATALSGAIGKPYAKAILKEAINAERGQTKMNLISVLEFME